MKLFLFLMFSISLQLQAEDTRLPLNSRNEYANSDKVIIVRNHKTPSKVDLTMKVPSVSTQCIEWDSRTVFGPDPSCGYRRVCSPVAGPGYCRYRDQYGRCISWGHGPVRYHCRTVMRSCYHEDSFCSAYGDVTRWRNATVRLKFKNMTKLAVGEEETFEVEAKQAMRNRSNIIFSIEQKEARDHYDLSVKKFFRDKIVIKGTQK